MARDEVCKMASHIHSFFFEIGFGAQAAKTNFKKEEGDLVSVTQGGVRSELALG